MNIHERGKEIAKRWHRSNIDMIEILIELDRTKSYRELGHPSVQVYAVKEFRLTKDVARSLIRIARKSVEFVELKEAIASDRVTVSKCEKVAAKLTQENVAEVLDYLEKHSVEKTLEWLGRDEEYKMNLKIAFRIVDKLRHGISLTREKLDLEAMVEVAIDEYNERHDPVQKAERAKKRKEAKRGISRTAKSVPKQRQYPAALRHALNRRDQRQCRHRDSNHERCEHNKYIDFHHIIEVSEGGQDTLENMITLCSAHHKMVHERQIPRSLQREWQTIE